MKKLLLTLLCLSIATSLVACDMGGNGTNGGMNGDNTDNGGNTTDFDTSKVTFAAAYAKAQELGFEGTLDEFIKHHRGRGGSKTPFGDVRIAHLTPAIQKGHRIKPVP